MFIIYYPPKKGKTKTTPHIHKNKMEKMDLSTQIEFGDGHKHTFRLDTGAECKVLPLKAFYKVAGKNVPLMKPCVTLLG